MKTKILLLFTVVALLIACEVNKTSNLSITEADLIGNWNLTSMTMEDGTIMGVSEQGESISGNCAIIAKDIDMIFSFTDSLKMLSVQGRLTAEITISNSSTMMMNETFDTNTDPIRNLAWKLNPDNTITVARNPKLVFNIKEFSTNCLKLSAELNETRSYNGEPATIEGTMNIVLEN